MLLRQSKFSFKTVLAGLAVATAIALPSVTAKAAPTAIRDQSKVQLYYNDTCYVYHGTTSSNIYIKVANNIQDKDVKVKYKTSTKEDTGHAEFIKNLDADYSIYQFHPDVSMGDIEYTIEAENGNHTEAYIDDNNGKKYTSADILGAANISARRTNGSVGSSYYPICAAVKNLGYTKDIKVRYTLDNWNTYKEVPLSHDNYKYNDDDSCEIWSTSIDTTGATSDTFQYCLYYTVNGQTYWDNNFGRNYNSNFYSPY